MEPVTRDPVRGEGDQLVHPGHEHPGAAFTESQNLRWFGVDRVRKGLGVEAVAQEVGVLPEQLVEHVVGVGVDR